MQHSGNDVIVDVDVTTGDLGRNVGARQRLADQHVTRGRLERRLRIHLDVEAALADQLGEADAAPSGRAHCAVGERQVCHRHAQPLGGDRQQRLARRRRGLAQLDAATHDAGASGRRALVGRQCGIALDELNAVDRDGELLADHLAHRDAMSCAEVDLARPDDDRAVAANGEERVDRVERQGAGDGVRRSGLATGRRRRRREAEAHDQRSGFEQGTPRQRRADRRAAVRAFHGQAFAVSAARCTARRTRSCEPQRQRFPANACCACSRVGRGCVRSSATAVITMPLVQ